MGLESLECRRLLTREGLVGIDFDVVGGAKPTNWSQYTGSPNPSTVLNLSDESGAATDVDFTISGGLFGFNTAITAIPAAQVPIHTPALGALGGNISTSASSITINWSGLSSEAAYLVYVFGISGSAATTNVAIQGDTATNFQQTMSANQLAINSELGSNHRTLDSYGVSIKPNAQGQIQLTLTEVSGNIPLAGVALQAYDPDDQITEAIDPLFSTYPLAGNIDAFDVDMYRIPATAGERLLFDLDVPGGSLDSILRLFDSQGTPVAFSDDNAAPGEPSGTESYLDYTFPATGVYYLGVSGFNNSLYDPGTGTGDVSSSTGAYQIFIDSIDPDDQLVEATALSLSASVDGTLETGRDVDMYKFNLTLGERISIDVDYGGSGDSDSILRLFNAAGSQLAFSDDNAGPGESSSLLEPFLDFTAPATGLYYLGVSAFPNSLYDAVTGHGDAAGQAQTYRLQVTIVDPSDPDDQFIEAPVVTLNNMTTGSISTGTDVDMVRFDVTAGQRVTFDLDRPNGTLDSILRLFDNAGNQLQLSDDNSAPGEPISTESYIDYTFANAGTYFLGISGFINNGYNPISGSGDTGASSTGNYKLLVTWVNPDDPDDQFAEATNVALNTTLADVISNSTDVDMLRFDVTSGQRVTFDLDHTGFLVDSVLRLFDNTGIEIALSDDNLGPGEPVSGEPFIDFTFATTGTYFLGISGFFNGSYSPILGTGDVNGDIGSYTMTITLVDPSDPDDQLFEAPAAMTNSMFTGDISTGTDVDMVRINVASGQRLAIDLDRPSGALDSILRLFDNAGNQLAFSDDDGGPGEGFSPESYIDYTFPAGGIYYLGVSGFSNVAYDPNFGTNDGSNNSSGAYKVTITVVDPMDPDDQLVEAIPTSVGTATHATLGDLNDVDMYKLNVIAGQTISFDIDRPPQGPYVDSVLRLFDAQGIQLALSDDDPAPGEGFSAESFLSHNFAVGGTYFVGVSVFSNLVYDPATGVDPQPGSTTGDYTLVIRWECGLIGDANGDGSVGAGDYTIWAAQFGQSGGGLSADFDSNGSVGAGDYALWAANFGKTCISMGGGSAAPAAPSASLATLNLPSSATTANPANASPAEPQRDPVAARPARNHRAALDRIFADLARSRSGTI